jgi:hypothetical protein
MRWCKVMAPMPVTTDHRGHAKASIRAGNSRKQFVVIVYHVTLTRDKPRDAPYWRSHSRTQTWKHTDNIRNISTLLFLVLYTWPSGIIVQSFRLLLGACLGISKHCRLRSSVILFIVYNHICISTYECQVSTYSLRVNLGKFYLEVLYLPAVLAR